MPKRYENHPQVNERCFYTRENGLIIDTLRAYIDTVEDKLQPYLLAPLLIKVSIHTNTAGVFKDFTKINKPVLVHLAELPVMLYLITKPIQLTTPLWSSCSFTPHIYHNDINQTIAQIPDTIDVIYLDPPYNQHPYASNYFMLNLIATNQLPNNISKVSGIPKEWTRSNYNYRDKAIQSMKELLSQCVAKANYVLLSYNNEGIITVEDWKLIFEPYQVKKKSFMMHTKGLEIYINEIKKLSKLSILLNHAKDSNTLRRQSKYEK